MNALNRPSNVKPLLPAALDDADRACRGQDRDRFFPRDGERRDELIPRMQATADEFCQACPVLASCREAGYGGRELGLWGGVLHIWQADRANYRNSIPLLGWRPTP